jgi:hypothetical protein
MNVKNTRPLETHFSPKRRYTYESTRRHDPEEQHRQHYVLFVHIWSELNNNKCIILRTFNTSFNIYFCTLIVVLIFQLHKGIYM